MTNTMTPSEIADWHSGIADFTNDVKRRDFHRKAAATIREFEAREARLRAALEKIDAIRNSIVGYQRVGFSEHVYPLVAALGEAGFEGESYEKCREDVGTALQQRDNAEAKLKIATEALDRIGEAKGGSIERGGSCWSSRSASMATQALARIKEVG